MTKTAKMNIIAAIVNGAYMHNAIMPQKIITAAMNESINSITYHLLLFKKINIFLLFFTHNKL